MDILLYWPAASNDRSGTGSLTASATLTSSGRKAAGGSGSLAGSAGFTSSGRRAATGTGSLTASASFTQTGRKAARSTHDAAAEGGAEELQLQASFTRSGRKAGLGTGALATTATLTNAGRMGAKGAGALSLSAGSSQAGSMGAAGAGGSIAPTLGYGHAGTKAGTGRGNDLETATLAATGIAAQDPGVTGTGSLVLDAAFSSAGHKDTGGTGSLTEYPVLVGGPTIIPLIAHRGAGRPVARAVSPVRRSGTGRLVIHPRMWAAGIKASEVDDELVLALAA